MQFVNLGVSSVVRISSLPHSEREDFEFNIDRASVKKMRFIKARNKYFCLTYSYDPRHYIYRELDDWHGMFHLDYDYGVAYRYIDRKNVHVVLWYA
jgi:hypothetical protein